MKSIRKDNVKTTASDLGVSIGDVFEVLNEDDSFDKTQHIRLFNTGELVEFINDDGTDCPKFKSIGRGVDAYESFSCLAPYSKVEHICQETKVESMLSLSTSFKDGEINISLKSTSLDTYIKLVNFIKTL